MATVEPKANMSSDNQSTMSREEIRRAALKANQVRARVKLAEFTATVFRDVGGELHVMGHFIGTDRRGGVSPFGHGDDATVAVSMLLRIGSQLVSASADLITDGRAYAGSALIRQLWRWNIWPGPLKRKTRNLLVGFEPLTKNGERFSVPPNSGRLLISVFAAWTTATVANWAVIQCHDRGYS
jgi:hypothetical protein